MAHPHRPVVQSHGVRAARSGLSLVKFLALGGLGALVTAAALSGNGLDRTADHPGLLDGGVPIVEASLTYAGTDPVITGSVTDLFATSTFRGPNRAEKTDRVRPKVDALALSHSFAEVRTRLAALRDRTDPALLGQSRVADVAIAAPAVEEGPRMSVASLDPMAGAEALAAIAGIAPSAAPLGGPLPMVPSEQLAYARANAPVTGAFSTQAPVLVSDKELWCLATAIYFEARGETYRGQVAVAQVVMNRVNDRRYPKTICGVVFQNQTQRNACQFSFACDGIPEVTSDKKSWDQAQDIAARFVDGELYLTEVADATHYHATYVKPAWAPRMQRVTQIGLHVFYKFKRGWLFG